ncbi:MAG: hypothetical protein ABJP02_04855 [Parasphingorhabdus sp.]|uniref:DUF6950 family protein n=1 Tax=Parasphingorhabdus sp. TaxID=2709688 RepID=UPI003297C9A0
MKKLERLPEWEENLLAWITACSGARHQWGKLDCLLFAGGAIKAVTGFDAARGHRGKYRTELGAARYLKRMGHDSPEDYLNAHFPACPPASAQRGDLVLADDMAGVCMGSFALFIGEENDVAGLVRVPFSEWQAAWKIG